MLKEFYKKALPTQGVYCVTGIDPVSKKARNLFSETLDALIVDIVSLKAETQNVFVGTYSYNGHSRRKESALYGRSLFLDIDVGVNKPYPSKLAALTALDQFVGDVGMPPPIKVDSGTGVHAYWFLDQDVPAVELVAYSNKLKDLCGINELHVDPAVMGDAARIMRAPFTYNYKVEPAAPTDLYDAELPVYSYDEFKDFLGEIEVQTANLLSVIPKGNLTEDQRAMLKLDNYETLFSTIAVKSLEGNGCGQIKQIIEQAASLPEPLWYAGLSIAQHCNDRDEAIHKLSEDYAGYDRAATEAKAAQTQGKPFSCTAFENLNPDGCSNCPSKGKITNALEFGRALRIAKPTEEGTTEGPVWKTPGSFVMPEAMYPFVAGVNGGVYMMVMRPTKKPDDKPVEDSVLLIAHDLYPIKRIYSKIDGECLLMRVCLPNDPHREFMLPMKYAYAQEKFKETLSSHGAFFHPSVAPHLMSYIVKWGQYLVNKNAAEVMRMQFGWTEDYDAFVSGGKEYKKDGTVVDSPVSPMCRQINKLLQPVGKYDLWKELVQKLDAPGLELHAFTTLAGFGSVLMHRTSTSGVAICLTGESGNAKTGALYAQQSIWGNPKDLTVVEGNATGNGMVGRYLALHNLPFGLDEVGDIDSKDLSSTIHKISHGKAKIRMQASVNAEREHEMSASLIATFTSNHSLYDKLTTLKRNPTGEVARLIEFVIHKPKIFESDPSMGFRVFNPLKENYGWAGPDFVQNVFRWGDERVNAEISKWILRFKSDFGDESSYRFYENLIGATFAAGVIANDGGITNFDLERIYNKVIYDLITIRDSVVKINDVDYESLLGEFINSHIDGILAINDGKVTMEPRGSLVIRAEVDKGVILISKPAFRQYLATLKVSTREFVFSMKAKGVEIHEHKKRMGAGWKDATGTTIVVAYVIDTSKLHNPLIDNALSSST